MKIDRVPVCQYVCWERVLFPVMMPQLYFFCFRFCCVILTLCDILLAYIVLFAHILKQKVSVVRTLTKKCQLMKCNYLLFVRGIFFCTQTYSHFSQSFFFYVFQRKEIVTCKGIFYLCKRCLCLLQMNQSSQSFQR